MAELLEWLARALVSEPDAVQVEQRTDGDACTLVLRVAPGDLGRVIGRGGRTARALRTVVRASAVREGRRVSVEIIGD